MSLSPAVPGRPSAQSPFRAFREQFERNRRRALPQIDATGVELDPEVKKSLTRSLAIFQRGEAGEGRIAKEIDHTVIAGIDDDYRAAVKLFVAEEGRHARVLTTIVRALGGEILRGSWQDGLFRDARRLLGLRFKLVVLCVAEVISVTFYALIAAASSGALRAALEEICADEVTHLRFHATFFRTHITSQFARAAFHAAFWCVGLAALSVVLFDHRSTIARLGRTPYSVASDFFVLMRETERMTHAPKAVRTMPNRMRPLAATGLALSRPTFLP